MTSAPAKRHDDGQPTPEDCYIQSKYYFERWRGGKVREDLIKSLNLNESSISARDLRVAPVRFPKHTRNAEPSAGQHGRGAANSA